MEATIAADKRKITSLTKKNDNLLSEGTEKSRNLNETRQELQTLKKQLEKLSEELATKSDKLEGLQCTYDELVDSFNQRGKQIEDLSKCNGAQEAMIRSYELEAETQSSNRLAEKNHQILIQHIIELLSHNQMTAMELLGKCKRDGLDVSIEGVKSALLEIEKKYIIRNRHKISIPTIYKLEKPQLLTNAEMFLDSKGKDCVDVLLLSDLHLNQNSNSLKRIFHTIYSYCEANGIKHIWDAGDFLNTRCSIGDIEKFNRAKEFYLENLPIDSRYNYMVIGGNHDKESICYEGDLLQDICDLKEGMHFLGHKNAFIYFDKNKCNAFALHHPSIKYEDSLHESDTTLNGNTPGRNAFYKRESKDPNNTYADIYGHSHFGRIDMINGCIYVPSFTHDRFLDGAYHLKIHFDENRNIKYMTIIHLIHKNEKLRTVSESTYQKLELKL